VIHLILSIQDFWLLGTCTGAVCQDDNSYGAVIRETILESVDKNTVKISYATGDKNTTINIHCAKVGESSDPRLSSSDDKSLVIDWFTSHGCTADNIPQAQPGQCIIKSDEYSVDLTPLGKGLSIMEFLCLESLKVITVPISSLRH